MSRVSGDAIVALERSELERALLRETPLIEAPRGAGLDGVRFKLENLQRTGSFKLRGAARKLARMSEAERGRGVVAASAGNHGAGVALAASRAGASATVVVPEHAPGIKRERIAALGAEVMVRGAGYDDAERYARELAHERGAVFISPFDDEMIMEGNGDTLADEIWRQCDGSLTALVVPVGGGGLIAGLARRLAPRGIRVFGVQPENNCAMYESLACGRALTEYTGRPTLAEGCEGAVAERTYAQVKAHVERIALVSEDAIRRAVAFAYRRLGVSIECSSAVALAGLLEGALEGALALDGAGRTVCVLTGGNIEPDALDEMLRESSA